MINLLMDFFRLVFCCYLGYIAFIICKVMFDVVVVAVQYYCFGKKPTPASKKSETKEKETEVWYNDWD